MATLFQAFANGRMVVDLAIENQPHAIGAATHWLVPRFRQIDDGQSPKAKATATVVKDKRAGVVRPTMRHHIAHALNQRAVDIAARRRIFPDSANTTHAF